MKAFQLTPWQKRVIQEKFRRKEKVAAYATRAVEVILRQTTEKIVSGAMQDWTYREPDLSAIFPIFDAFYYNVIAEGVDSARTERQPHVGKKRLAGTGALPKGKIPPISSLVDIFKDKRTWPAIMKRSKYLAERLRKAYLRKLKTRFTQVVPRIMDGSISPKEAQDKLMDAWWASRSRVNTIFRTETTKYFAEAQVAYFDGDPDIIGFLFDSVRDTARTGICKSRHGLVYRPGSELLKKNTPPCHWSCRSHLIPLADTDFNRKMLADPKRDPSKISVVPLPPGWHTK